MKKLLIILILIVAVVAALALFYSPAKAAISRIFTTMQNKSTVKSTNDNDLVGYWNFDSCDTCTTVIDNSGKGNNGAISDVNASGLATRVAGKVNNALKFDGVDDFVNVLTSKSLNLTTKYTFIAWIKLNSLNTQKQIIMKSGAYYLGVSTDNKIRYGHWGITAQTANTGLTTGTWYHVASVYDSNSDVVKAYLNGKVDGSYSTIVDAPVSANNLFIGMYSSSEYFNGSIDEVRVYNRALSAEEIKASYESQKGKFVVNASQNDKWKEGLVGFWSFNGGDMNWGANQALDRSGQGNHGTLTNMSTTTSPVEGVVGQALKFVQNRSFILVSGSSALKPTSQMTIEAWLYYSVFFNGWTKALIFPYGATSWTAPYFSYQIGGSVGRPHVGFSVNGTYTVGSLTSSKAFVLNTWTHVVGTFNNGIITLYVNGVFDSSKDVTGSGTEIIYTTRTDLVLGLDAEYYKSEGWGGSMDEVRIYNRALTAAEILEHYKAGRR